MKNVNARTSIAVKSSTKTRLGANRMPGQCYDGFLCQMLDLWEDHFNYLHNNNTIK